MMGRVRQFFQHVIPGVIRPMRVLWNEMIGFVFAVFAVIFGFRTARFIRGFEGGSVADLLMLLGMAFFTLMLAYFGVTSFLRARKIGRG